MRSALNCFSSRGNRDKSRQSKAIIMEVAGQPTRESEITLFFLRAPGPRPTFAADMTEEERKVMNEHVAYWKARLDEGKALVFGPVLDPKEIFGIAIVDARDEAEMRALIASDPAVKAGVHVKDEFYSMSPRTFVRK